MNLHIQMTEQSRKSDDILATLTAVLRERFGDDAVLAAERQQTVAEGNQRDVWAEVVTRLSQ